MRPLSQGLLSGLLGALLCAGCGQGDSAAAAGGAGPPVLSSGDDDLSFLERVADSIYEVAYRGERLVELYYHDPVVYREDVGSDGLGNFAIEVLQVQQVPQGMSAPLLAALLSESRQVYTYRFRDFRIRDYDLFASQYSAVIVDEDSNVAGRSTVQLDVQRVKKPQVRYRVDVDPETGLVMRWVEYDIKTGKLNARVAFETFALDQDLSDMTLVSRNFPTTVVDRNAANLNDTFGFEVRFPAFLPGSTFVVLDQVDRMEADGKVWAKIYVTDGLEVILVMHSAPVAAKGASAGAIEAAQAGSWIAVEGELGGYPVLAAGRVRDSDLFLILQATFVD